MHYAAPPTSAIDGPIVVIGDTQRTSFPELCIGREQNEDARRALITRLANDEHPAFVVHLGDFVDIGGIPEHWEYADRLLSPLTSRGVRIYPVLGNHDTWTNRPVGLREAARRFPILDHGTFYTFRHHGLGLVFLDSNLSGNDAEEQTRWFEERLRAYEHDPTIRGVLVFAHHPAYTNAKCVGPSSYVHDDLVPRFFAYRKTVAFVTGHVHGYEHFVVNHRTFVVSGGGGGPRVEYHVGKDAHPAPAYVTPDGRRRAFNYVVIDDQGATLRFTVKCLETKDSVCKGGVLETFTVDVPPAPQPRCSPLGRCNPSVD
jgi:3',5'-cyclic AMP phosphodiesterase CpdA